MIGWLPFAFHSLNLVYVLMLGMIGAIPFMLINGVHGDMEGIRGIVGCVLFVVTNAAVYYGISSFILKQIRVRKKRRTQHKCCVLPVENQRSYFSAAGE
jgi:Na+-translocating ferredoxin:NAD+ oxidoreductase RnfA subunit